MINKLGTSVCHQIPERSLKMGGLILPICSRDSGIYIGFFICAIFMFLIFRKRESDLPPLYVFIILIIFILSTVADGLLSYLSVIETNNIARFTTGFLSGSSTMAIIYPIFNYQYYKDSYNIRIFVSPLKFIFFIAVDALIIFITLLQLGFLKYFYYYLSAFAVIFTFFGLDTGIGGLQAGYGVAYFGGALIIPFALWIGVIHFYQKYKKEKATAT